MLATLCQVCFHLPFAGFVNGVSPVGPLFKEMPGHERSNSGSLEVGVPGVRLRERLNSEIHGLLCF